MNSGSIGRRGSSTAARKTTSQQAQSNNNGLLYKTIQSKTSKCTTAREQYKEISKHKTEIDSALLESCKRSCTILDTGTATGKINEDLDKLYTALRDTTFDIPPSTTDFLLMASSKLLLTGLETTDPALSEDEKTENKVTAKKLIKICALINEKIFIQDNIRAPSTDATTQKILCQYILKGQAEELNKSLAGKELSHKQTNELQIRDTSEKKHPIEVILSGSLSEDCESYGEFTATKSKAAKAAKAATTIQTAFRGLQKTRAATAQIETLKTQLQTQTKATEAATAAKGTAEAALASANAAHAAEKAALKAQLTKQTDAAAAELATATGQHAQALASATIELQEQAQAHAADKATLQSEHASALAKAQAATTTATEALATAKEGHAQDLQAQTATAAAALETAKASHAAEMANATQAANTKLSALEAKHAEALSDQQSAFDDQKAALDAQVYGAKGRELSLKEDLARLTAKTDAELAALTEQHATALEAAKAEGSVAATKALEDKHAAELASVSEKAETAEAALAAATAQIETLKTELAAAQAGHTEEIEELKTQHQAATDAAKTAAAAQIETLQGQLKEANTATTTELAEAKTAQIQSGGFIAGLENNIAGLRREAITARDTHKQELQAQTDRAAKEIAALKAQHAEKLAEANTAKDTAEAALTTAKEGHVAATAALEAQHKQELQTQTAATEAAKAETATKAAIHQEALASAKTKHEIEIAELKNRLTTAESLKEAADEALTALDELSTIEANLEERETISNLRRKTSELNAQIQNQRRIIQTLKEEETTKIRDATKAAQKTIEAQSQKIASLTEKLATIERAQEQTDIEKELEAFTQINEVEQEQKASIQALIKQKSEYENEIQRLQGAHKEEIKFATYAVKQQMTEATAALEAGYAAQIEKLKEQLTEQANGHKGATAALTKQLEKALSLKKSIAAKRKIETSAKSKTQETDAKIKQLEEELQRLT
eukprot:COSAG01_NODE_1288_length_10887_cov_324.284761_1_plen_969_part_10